MVVIVIELRFAKSNSIEFSLRKFNFGWWIEWIESDLALQPAGPCRSSDVRQKPQRNDFFVRAQFVEWLTSHDSLSKATNEINEIESNGIIKRPTSYCPGTVYSTAARLRHVIHTAQANVTEGH